MHFCPIEALILMQSLQGLFGILPYIKKTFLGIR